jgi:hypothetical protein
MVVRLALVGQSTVGSFVGDEVLKLGYYVVRYRFGLF